MKHASFKPEHLLSPTELSTVFEMTTDTSEFPDPLSLIVKMMPRLEQKIVPAEVSATYLPETDVDFAPFFERIIPMSTPDIRDHDRSNMDEHWNKLRHQSRGRAEILAIHMLLISYLRRDTKYTERAWALFERLWSEYNTELLNIIPTRGLISALRTFADHTTNSTQRLAAKLGFVYGHMIKVYESERAVEGGDLKKANYQVPGGCPKIGLKNSWGILMGKDNSFEIVNLLMAEEVTSDDIVGPMILTLLARVQEGDTVFSRYDRARIQSDFQLKNKLGWSFGFRPTEA